MKSVDNLHIVPTFNASFTGFYTNFTNKTGVSDTMHIGFPCSFSPHIIMDQVIVIDPAEHQFIRGIFRDLLGLILQNYYTAFHQHLVVTLHLCLLHSSDHTGVESANVQRGDTSWCKHGTSI